MGSVALGRELVREAIGAELGDDDLVYMALWLKLLERRAATEPDGTAAEAFANVSAKGGWVAHLREWGTGALDDAGLRASATSIAERTEATFYTGLGDTSGAGLEAALDAVARSPAIDLVEVTIARDLLAASGGPGPALPAGIALP